MREAPAHFKTHFMAPNFGVNRKKRAFYASYLCTGKVVKYEWIVAGRFRYEKFSHIHL